MPCRSMYTVAAAALAAAAVAGCGSSAASHSGASSAAGSRSTTTAASSQGASTGTSASSAASTAPETANTVYRWGSFGKPRRADSKLPNGGGGSGVGAAGGGGGSGGGGHRHHHHGHHGAGGSARAGGGGGAASGAHQSVPVAVHGIVGTVRQIATSNSDGYALTTQGAVYAWGNGSGGQLGNGTTTKRSLTAVRVHFPAGVTIAKLPNPMPFDGGMAIDTHGDLWGWGNDQNRELCEPGSANLDTPVKTPLSDVTQAVGAQRHALYLTHGHLVSCGLGLNGQIGDGTSGARSQTTGPVRVKGLPSGPIRTLTAGYGNAGVLMADGQYYDWGLNNHGQVGNGSETDATTAQHVSLPAEVVAVDEGGSVKANGQALALLSDGQLWEWGAGTLGQLGNGSTSDRDKPIEVPEPSGVHFTRFASGGATDFGATGAGTLYAWGSNALGELGDGSTAKTATRAVKDGLTVIQIASTAGDVAALSR